MNINALCYKTLDEVKISLAEQPIEIFNRLLIRSTISGRLDIVDYCIQSGADIDTIHSSCISGNITALTCAVVFDHVHIFEYLFTHGIKYESYEELVKLAQKYSSYHISKYLATKVYIH